MWVKGGTALFILTLSSRQRWVVNFMPWTIWGRGKSLLLAKKGSTNSCLAQFVAESLHTARQPDSRLLSKTDHMLHQHVQKSNSQILLWIPCIETFSTLWREHIRVISFYAATLFPSAIRSYDVQSHSVNAVQRNIRFVLRFVENL
jgi:hypothetical protein